MIVNLPYSIPVGKKDDKFYVNLNQYRNAHYHTLNSAKITFKELISDQVKQLPKFNVIKLWYRVFAPSKRLVDTNNICSIADKFFCDALVEAGKLEDDNYNFLIETRFTFGGIDKGNPRVEVEIEETQPMKIIFGKDEILSALTNYVHSHLGIPVGDAIAVSLKAQDDGFEAILDMPMPSKPVAKPVAYRETSREGSVGSMGSRAAVTEALQGVKTLNANTEKPAEKAAEKPSLLNTTPAARSKPIDAPEAVDEPSARPTESQEGATTAEPTQAAPAEGKAEPAPEITANPENRKETGTVGGAPNPEPAKSIFNFRNK